MKFRTSFASKPWFSGEVRALAFRARGCGFVPHQASYISPFPCYNGKLQAYMYVSKFNNQTFISYICLKISLYLFPCLIISKCLIIILVNKLIYNLYYFIQ